MSSNASASPGLFESATFIRLQPKSKQPVGKDFDAAKCDYAGASEWVRVGAGNVGLVLDSGTPLLDVDLDEPRLLPIADHWLPPTPWMFGRDSSPRSHRLYTVVTTRKPLAFNHGDKVTGWKAKRFVDLRCDMQGKAGYTVVPPGTHQETGERIVWMTEGNVPRVGRPSQEDPPRVDFLELVRCAGILASIAIAASCWAEGGRHDMMLALEGYLAKKGWDADQRRQYLHDVNDISDNPWDPRERDGQIEPTLRNTQRKLEAGDQNNVGGIQQLKALMGEKQARAFEKAINAHEYVAKEQDGGDDGHAAFTWDGFAREFGTQYKLVYWEDDAYAYTEGQGWVWVNPGVVDRWALNWLASRMIGKHGELKASPSDVRDLVKTAKTQLMLYARPPVVIADDKTSADAAWLIGVGNGVIDLRTGTLEPYTADVFLPQQTHVLYEPEAKSPRWDAFLQSLISKERDAEECEKRLRSIEEMLAYSLTHWRGAQKIFALIGPPRSGKGTLLRVMQLFLGQHVVSLEFSDLGTHFGLETVVGKSVMYIHEPAADYRHTDLEVITSRLKAISGGDELAVARKNKINIRTRLDLAIIMAMNEFPRLNDSSGALASRFHPVALTESFLGREDTRLDSDLRAEASGILAKLVRVARDLYEQQQLEGRVSWTLTKAGTRRAETNEAQTGSLLQFSNTALRHAEGVSLTGNDVFDAFMGYCAERGATVRRDYRAEGGIQKFMSALSHMPIMDGVAKTRRRINNKTVTVHLDIELTEQGREWMIAHREDSAPSEEKEGGRGSRSDSELPF